MLMKLLENIIVVFILERSAFYLRYEIIVYFDSIFFFRSRLDLKFFDRMDEDGSKSFVLFLFFLLFGHFFP